MANKEGKLICRRATHAGSWYQSDARSLDKELSNWLSQADISHSPARAIISPHAGYRYCGATAAFAFKQINPENVKRVFILGPSHHVYLSGCGITPAQIYQTPLYDLRIDTEVVETFMKSGEFKRIDLSVDEEEHSIEMQLSFLAKVMESKKTEFTVVPIMVGDLKGGKGAAYGKLLSPYLEDPTNLFVISSDFCHWGNRFRFTYYDKKYGEIHESIESLDRMGMGIIESLSSESFTEYLSQYGNTICGRNPITLLLHTCEYLCSKRDLPNCKLKFLHYSQSSQVKDMSDSSVSYAAAVLTL